MLLARIDDQNKVAELIDWPDNVDYAAAFHPSVRLVKVGPGVKVGSAWDGKSFSSVSEVTEVKLPKEELRARARLHRLVLFDSLKVKVGELESWFDKDTLAAISSKIDLIDRGVLPQPIKFKLIGGFADLSRSDLAALQKAIAERAESLFAAEAAALEGIEKGRIKNQEQLEAAFAARIQ